MFAQNTMRLLNYCCQRYRNNSKPLFANQEILKIYLFVGGEQLHTQIKGLHSLAKEYLLDRIPGLVLCWTFVYRMSRMGEAVQDGTAHVYRGIIQAS